jgi:hypothetical protein
MEYNEGRKISVAEAVQMSPGSSILRARGALVAMKKRADT